MEHAKHRLEVATNLVCDIKRMEKEAEGDEDYSSRGKKISPLQVKEMVDAFNLFDRDGNNKLDAKELGAVFRALGQNPTESELEEAVIDFDANGDGSIDKEEFIVMLTDRMQSQEEIKRDLEDAFDTFDRNDDESIDKKELMRVLRMTGDRLTEVEAEEMITLMGGENVQTVTKNEFIKFLCPGFNEEEEPQEPERRKSQIKGSKR